MADLDLYVNQAAAEALRDLLRQHNRSGAGANDVIHKRQSRNQQALHDFPAKITARQQFEKGKDPWKELTYGASTYFGIYDWEELVIEEDDEWVDFAVSRSDGRKYGRQGKHSEGTGAVEAMFTNRAIEAAGDMIVWMRRIREPKDEKYLLDKWKDPEPGFAYVFDLDIPNEDASLRKIV